MSKIKTPIVWADRYSSTMENDEQGRWARVGLAGKNINNRINVDIFQIAWIEKYHNSDFFYIKYYYPYNGKHLFSTLEEAKTNVEVSFKHFINCCK